MTSLIRAAAANVGLALGGALLGALMSAGVFGLFALVAVFRGGFPYLDLAFAAAAAVGAVIGGVLGPVLRWTLLRDVPLRQVIVSVASGAVLWGVVGFVGAGFNPVIAVGTAPMGAVVHAIRLRARTRPSSRGMRPVVY